jgi:glycosyltransferase involved in cell wall biosynthesis
MKVLAITSVGYEAGGAETILAKIHPYLSEKGYDIKTLASDLGANKAHFNDYTFKHISSTGPLKLLFFLFNPYSFSTLKKLLKDYKPDVVHLHIMHEVTPSVLFLLKNYPTVITLHGSETFLSKLVLWKLRPENFKEHVYTKKDLNMAGKLTYLYFKYIQKIPYKWGLKNVDTFIAPSKYMQNVARTDVSPIIHLPNFIELQTFHELTNNYNLLFVGRLEKIKGVEFLIQAVSLIVKVFPQTRLTIIGDGRNKTDLFNLTKKLQIEKYIQFRGWVEHKDLATYYEKASIVVIPSVVPENFPTVCNEAMSAGRLVIGTKVGGIPEIIDDGVNGYLVEPANSEQIAEKVIKLFLEEKLLKELGRNARQKAEEFSIEKHVDGLEKVYGKVMSKYKLQNSLNEHSSNYLDIH